MASIDIILHRSGGPPKEHFYFRVFCGRLDQPGCVGSRAGAPARCVDGVRSATDTGRTVPPFATAALTSVSWTTADGVFVCMAGPAPLCELGVRGAQPVANLHPHFPDASPENRGLRRFRRSPRFYWWSQPGSNR